MLTIDNYLAPHFIHRSNRLRAAVLGANVGIISLASLSTGFSSGTYISTCKNIDMSLTLYSKSVLNPFHFRNCTVVLCSYFLNTYTHIMVSPRSTMSFMLMNLLLFIYINIKYGYSYSS
jgi:hypothetical protein